MDRIAFDRLIDEGELIAAQEEIDGPSGFEELFFRANRLGWDSIPA